MDSEDWHSIALEAAIAGAMAIHAIAVEDFATQGKSGVEDFVTAADIASEQAIIQVIRTHRLHDQIVAEETGNHPGTSGIRWYIDPLDGTANLIAGSPDYAVCVSAHRKDETTLAAVIYRPADHMWLATSTEGAVHGTIVPALAPSRSLDKATITVSRPHDPARREEAMALRTALLPYVTDEQRVGSAACALLRVIAGQLDAYISVDLPVWDTAAGHCLLERTGGAVISLHSKAGTPLRIAGEPNAAEALAELTLAHI